MAKWSGRTAATPTRGLAALSEHRAERVLEIGGHAAGYCGRLFARAGADVVRVEAAATPAWVSPQAMELYLHAGKRRITEVDRSTLARLADAADVVIVEAAGASALEALGYDEWPCGAKVSITPFGRTGPRRDWRATPATLLAMGGQTTLSGDADRAPLTIPGHYLEFQAGTLAYLAVNAALLEAQTLECAARDSDVSLLEVSMSLTQFSFIRWQCLGDERTRHGNAYHYLVPMNTYACADGAVYVNVVPAFWDAFTLFIDRPELLVDDRFSTNALRVQHAEELNALTAEVLAPLTRAQIIARAEAARLPVGAVMSIAEVLHDPHLDARGFWETATHPSGASVRVPSVPFAAATAGEWQVLPVEERAAW